MLGNAYYYRNQMKRYAVAFMSLFDDIWIQKNVAGSNTASESIKVPIQYGPKEKWLARLQADPTLTKPTGISLPQMSMLFTGMNYASDRKLQSVNKYLSNTSVTGDASSRSFVYTPIPIDIMVQLNIMTLAVDDAHQIIEQILPCFTPDWTNRIRLVDELDIEFNVPVLFTVASSTDTYDSGFQERRVLTWTMDFIMKAYFVGPTQTAKVIKIAKSQLSVNLDNPVWSVEANVSPGMLANGSPTSNQQLSISPLDITANDTYGYVVQITDETK